MWENIVLLAAAVLLVSRGTHAMIPIPKESVVEGNGNLLIKFLCGDEYEKCYGERLNSAIYVNNDKIYKMEAYKLQPPQTLDNIVEEQQYMRTALDKVLAERDEIFEQLGTAQRKFNKGREELSNRMEEQTQRLRSEFQQNMKQHKWTILNSITTKFDRLRKRIGSATSTDNNDDGDVYSNLPASCAEAFAKDDNAESGTYELYLPDFFNTPFEVYCLADPDGGDAWTVIQRRTDGSEDFYRDWDEYVEGFGDFENEFFIGLDKLHALTNDQPNELWIQMEDFEGEERYAKYEDFAIGDDTENYALNKLRGFTGDAGDSMAVQKGQEFTTKDRDNDSDPTKNCAVEYTGAWWYNQCHDSNLNGRYLGGSYDYDEDAQGIDWYTWHRHTYSLKYVHMAIRPKVSRQ